jgi:hypothetical protein
MAEAAPAVDPNASGVTTPGGAPPDTKTPPTKVEGGKPDAKTEVKVDAKPEIKTDPKPGEAPEPDDDADLRVTEKNGKKFIQLSQDKFKDRLQKHTKKELKELFGTSDRNEIMRWKKKYDEFEADAEKRKREEMTERQKIEADRDAALSAKEVAERRAARATDYVDRQKTQRKVAAVARDHVHPDKLDMALGLFRLHLSSLSRKKLDALVKDKTAWGEWFKDLAVKNPEMSKAGAVKVDEPVETKTEKKPAGNGLSPKDKPQPDKGGSNGKSVKEMTPAELKAFAASKGIKLSGDMQFVDPTGGGMPRPQQMLGK